uniref:Uncharacterized protein n=1 Tax=Setaria viridis TaxID=4556 RepID=A0A4U6TN77_SETVI|nr:hypothetical protein SEVIR_8G255700v2 [Setaria viridis]
MELSDDLAIMLLPDGDSLTDARYPDRFSDCGGSSGSSWNAGWVNQVSIAGDSNYLPLRLKGYICILSYLSRNSTKRAIHVSRTYRK